MRMLRWGLAAALIFGLFMAGSGAVFAKQNLLLAALRGDLETVSALVHNGADINQTNRSGNTPLMHAAGRGHADVVRFLIERGANIDHKNSMNLDALAVAASAGQKSVVELLRKSETIRRSTAAGFAPPIPSGSNSGGDTSAGAAVAPAKRIKQLQMLREQGLITEAEYASKINTIAGVVGDDSVSGRLKRLAMLQSARLLSAEEAMAKRREILAAISPHTMKPVEGLALLRDLKIRGLISAAEAAPLRKAFIDAI